MYIQHKLQEKKILEEELHQLATKGKLTLSEKFYTFRLASTFDAAKGYQKVQL